MAFKLLKTKFAALLCVAISGLTSCTEHIDESTRYTYTGHTVASFLESYPETYSSFIEILDRGDYLSLMKAYGQYTCLAPTNEAITRYLREQDSIYRASLVDDNPNDIIWTGITSPELSELSDSMCRVISRTHLIPEVYTTLDLEGDIIPTKNMNDRILGLSHTTDKNSLAVIIINGNGKIISRDEEVENGVVHTISEVLNPSPNTLPSQIGKYKYFHIMSEALKATGYDEMMQDYIDLSYTDGDLMTVGSNGSGQTHYPANRYFGFSAFLEPDQLFYDKGIYNLDDLIIECAKWYPHADATAPLTSKKNPLNQFVAYHILDRNLPYSRLVCYNLTTDRWNSENDYFDTSDRNEFYETFANRLVKVTMPRSKVSNPGKRNTIYLNWYDEVNSPVEKYINTTVYSPNTFRDLNEMYADFDPNALNGTIHPINKILLYDEDAMAGRVLNMIVRIDFAGLLTELTNNDIRWNGLTQRYGSGELYIPNNFCKNLKVYSEESRIFYYAPVSAWGSYQGDEVVGFSSYDFAYKLPPMPAGTYEIRFGYSVGPLRGIVQYYFDDVATGIPVDLRISSESPNIGFIADAQTDDNGIQNDKEMKNRGYLKGPAAMCGNTREQIARDHPHIIRIVVTTKYLAEGEHWLRFKNVFEFDDGTAQFMHDYIEIVPLTYVRDESIPIEEKRK